MSKQTRTMWHLDELEVDSSPRAPRRENAPRAISRFVPKALSDPVLLVFAGPGGLPYLLRVLVTAPRAWLRRGAPAPAMERAAG